MQTSIGIIGFGEVGRILARGLHGKNGIRDIAVWDILFARDDDAGGAARAAVDAAFHRATNLADLCSRSDLLISAVTASNDLAVAQELVGHVRPGTILVDLNSASPGTKQRAAALLEQAGGSFVEAGVMTSVPPYGIRVPMLLGGSRAGEVAAKFADWGMDAKVVSAEIGTAAAIKMSRSIMIKGLEALVIESYTNARAYGVEAAVLATLEETFPQIDWNVQGAYFFSRVVQHGKRRAEEMGESAHTVAETGIQPLMASAIAHKQQWVADLASDGLFSGVAPDARWEDYADVLIREARRAAPSGAPDDAGAGAA